MAQKPMSEADLKKRLEEIEELYRQERLDALSDELSETVNVALESLRRDMVDATTSSEAPVDKIAKGRLASQAWSRKIRTVWAAWSRRLDMLDAVWTRESSAATTAASQAVASSPARLKPPVASATPTLTSAATATTSSTLKPFSQVVIEQLRGQLPRGNEPASGMAGRFFHMTEEARQAVTDSMTRSVIMGQSSQEIERSLRKMVDQPKARIKAWVRDANMQYARGVQLAYAEETGEEYFVYRGPVDDVTRPFCKRLEGKVLHRSEIDALDNGQTGQGTVLIAGGGYNCRHHWRPVRKEFFGDERWNQMRFQPDADEASQVSAPTVPPSMTKELEPLFLDPDAFRVPKGEKTLSLDAFSELMNEHFRDANGAWLGTPWRQSDFTYILPQKSEGELVQKTLDAALGKLVTPPLMRQTKGGDLLLLPYGKGGTITIRQWNTKSQEGEHYNLTVEFNDSEGRRKFKVKK